jgi:Cohesin loading factor
LRCKWENAQRTLDSLLKGLETEAFEVTDEQERWVVYMQAQIAQGTGNLDEARRLFRLPILHDAPKVASANKRLGQVRDDLWTLSRLHLYLMDEGADDGESTDAVMALLRASVPDRHPNGHLHCALALASATKTAAAAAAARRRSDGHASAGGSNITRQKAELQKALELARALGNAQLLGMSMTAFVGIFFAQITVGEQARKSRSTARTLAMKCGDPLWVAVTDGMLLQSEEGERREVCDRELQTMVGNLAEAVRGRFIHHA